MSHADVEHARAEVEQLAEEVGVVAADGSGAAAAEGGEVGIRYAGRPGLNGPAEGAHHTRASLRDRQLSSLC